MVIDLFDAAAAFDPPDTSDRFLEILPKRHSYFGPL